MTLARHWLGDESTLEQLHQLDARIESNMPQYQAGLEAQVATFLSDPEQEFTPGLMLIDNLGNGLALVNVSGSLVTNHKWWHPYVVGEVTSYDAIKDAMRILAEDDGVKKIVMVASSGGGAASGVDDAARVISEVAAIKPVIGITTTAAFSGMYWLISACSEVLSTRMGQVGSIGTLLVHTSYARMAKERGMDVTVFRAGEFKAMGHPMEELSEQFKATIQADVERINMFFLEHVASARNLSIADKSQWAEGRCHFAAEALSLGLIDRIVPSLDKVIGSLSASMSSTPGRSHMLISAEKRAQIEAGVAPESILTAEELQAWNAELSEQTAATETEETVDTKAKVGEEDAGTKPEVTEPAVTATTDDSLRVELSNTLRANGKLEAKVEALEAQIEALKASDATARGQVKALGAIAVKAVNNMQVALRKPATNPESPDAIVTEYEKLKVTMAERFPVGQQSAAANTGGETSTDANIDWRLRAQQSHRD